MNPKEVEKKMESIRMDAVGLTNEIADFLEKEGIDMWLEIINYFHEKRGSK